MFCLKLGQFCSWTWADLTRTPRVFLDNHPERSVDCADLKSRPSQRGRRFVDML